MAANSGSFIRVRLYFDYPPPAVIDCRMCWLLVDLNKCRVVADLESIIREKFEFSSRSILNLFIDDCYLPHTERIFVVRDNDSVRVKVDSPAQVNGHGGCSDTSSKNCKKRQRPTEEDAPGGNGVNVEWKEKKRKKKTKEGPEEEAKQAPGEEKSQEKHGEKKKRKKKDEENSPAAAPKPAESTKKTPTPASVKSTKKAPAAQAKKRVSSSDSSSSSSEEDEAPKKPPLLKPVSKTPLSTSAASKAPPGAKPTQTKPQPTSSSSSETDCSSDEAPSSRIPPKSKPLTSACPKSKTSDDSKSQQAPSALQSTSRARKQATGMATPPDDKVAEHGKSDSEDEIKLVIRRPAQHPGRGVHIQSPRRGCTRGRPGRGGPGSRGRGEGRGAIRGYNGAMEPCYQTDSLTNTSVVLQNGTDCAPKKDYSSMPLLAAPPQVGQRIAFKLLELAENYTPEISEYKEGKIVSFDPTTGQIELELLHPSEAPAEPGKFDLVYQNPDGSERVEYAVSRGAWVTERWDSLLEPRLVI